MSEFPLISMEDESVSSDDIYSPEMLEMFISEAYDLLEVTEKSFLALEKQTNANNYLELSKSILRNIHTLKGNSNLMGISPFEAVLHDLESFLEIFYENKWKISEKQVGILLNFIDGFREILSEFTFSQFPDFSKLEALVQLLTAQEIIEEPLTFEENKDPSTLISSRSRDIRVDQQKLDQLIALVGELGIVSSGLGSTGLSIDKQQNSNKSLDQLLHLSDELRELAMSMRMVPISIVFNRMERLVHDISKNLEKNVELETFGSETEVDKNLVEQISDPILHIIRNAVDHGIEKKQERLDSGKSEIATIQLTAGHKGNEVWIRIQDDGAGLSYDRIFAKAVQKGLIEESEKLDESVIKNLIFEPGFSTADKVSGISGRGVGLDVVKKNLDKMSGKIEVESYTGRGTRFTLRLPLTLAIIETLLVRIGNEYFSIPLSLVLECIELDREDDKKNGTQQLIKFHDTQIPYLNLRKIFKIEEAEPEHQQVIIVEHEGNPIGLTVDTAMDKVQSVIKPLGKLYENITYFSGASFIGSGELSLILDVQKLIESYQIPNE